MPSRGCDALSVCWFRRNVQAGKRVEPLPKGVNELGKVIDSALETRQVFVGGKPRVSRRKQALQ